MKKQYRKKRKNKKGQAYMNFLMASFVFFPIYFSLMYAYRQHPQRSHATLVNKTFPIRHTFLICHFACELLIFFFLFHFYSMLKIVHKIRKYIREREKKEKKRWEVQVGVKDTYLFFCWYDESKQVSKFGRICNKNHRLNLETWF